MPNRRPVQASERLLWIVAVASGVQAVLQAIDALLSGSIARFWLWMFGGFLIGALAAWAEKVKVPGGEQE